MNNNITLFENDEFGSVRSTIIKGNPYFIAKDICDILELKNVTQSLNGLDEDEKLIYTLHISGQNRELWLVNESGLYTLVIRSNKPEAKKFRKWITSEVIPSIRKTGSYGVKELSRKELAMMVIQAEEEKEKLQLQIEEQAPKVEFFDTVAESKDAISIGSTAQVLNKELNKKGKKIGQNKLFAFLRNQKILKDNNTPYQKYIDRGWFRVIEQKYEAKGEIRIYFKTLVYQKGVDGILRTVNKYLKGGSEDE